MIAECVKHGINLPCIKHNFKHNSNIMKLLADSNSKLKETSNYFDVKIFNFNIPAYNDKRTGKVTCPFAVKKIVDNVKIGCGWYCYADKNFYKFSNVQNGLSNKYQATKNKSFVDDVIKELNSKRTTKQIYVRIHDAGDFYSPAYLDKWIDIAKALPNIRFYAYTKSHDFFRSITLPDNFDITYSTGSKLDHKLNRLNEKHAEIFNSVKDLQDAGYVDAHRLDLYATKWFNNTNKVGLVFH